MILSPQREKETRNVRRLARNLDVMSKKTPVKSQSNESLSNSVFALSSCCIICDATPLIKLVAKPHITSRNVCDTRNGHNLCACRVQLCEPSHGMYEKKYAVTLGRQHHCTESGYKSSELTPFDESPFVPAGKW